MCSHETGLARGLADTLEARDHTAESPAVLLPSGRLHVSSAHRGATGFSTKAPWPQRAWSWKMLLYKGPVLFHIRQCTLWEAQRTGASSATWARRWILQLITGSTTGSLNLWALWCHLSYTRAINSRQVLICAINGQVSGFSTATFPIEGEECPRWKTVSKKEQMLTPTWLPTLANWIHKSTYFEAPVGHLW